MAPNAALRPFQMRALCSAEVLASMTLGSKARAISTMSRRRPRDFVLEAFDLDDEQRFDVERIAGLGVGLATAMAGLSMYSMATGMMPEPMMAATHWPAASQELKPSSTGRAACGLRQDLQRRFGDDAELALGADDERQEVVAFRIEVRAADLDDLAVHQHDLEAEHVVGRHAVFEAVGAARVHREVAADACRRAGSMDPARRRSPRPTRRR